MTDQDLLVLAEALGERLRNVRAQQGLSLQDVEQRSRGSLKASVVGAYERGERSVSVARLRVLADFYRVPITQLLPRNEATPRSPNQPSRPGIRLDLTRLAAMPSNERVPVERFLSSIQARRGDYNGKVLTIRHADLETISAILDLPVDELRRRLVPAAPSSEVPGPRAMGAPVAKAVVAGGPAAWMPQD